MEYNDMDYVAPSSGRKRVGMRGTASRRSKRDRDVVQTRSFESLTTRLGRDRDTTELPEDLTLRRAVIGANILMEIQMYLDSHLRGNDGFAYTA